ncbi:MAG: YjiH family protein [Tissierellia bacterium]|nr:YjiH family protein [Tissierellia bacterium]
MGRNAFNDKNYKLSDYLKFILPSLFGIILLMFPINYGGKTTIFVAVFADFMTTTFADIIPTIVLSFIGITAIISLLHKFFRFVAIDNSDYFKSIFDVSLPWVIVRLIGFSIAFMTYFKIGPEWIQSDNTGGLILYDLIGSLFTMFFIAGFLLPLLTDFGLLEFMGALLTPIMRPFFNLPGRSSIDCVASWVGDGTIGVALTNQQYIQGYYTLKEAAIISTTFSAVSITFCLVVLNQVGLTDYFGPYYLTIVLTGIAAAIIMPRIPPLSKKNNTYFGGKSADLGEDVPSGFSNFQWGTHLAIESARKNMSFSRFIKNGVMTILDLWLSVLPAIMAFGTIGLIIAEYTPVFTWLGKPFIPLLNIMKVPYAEEASKTIMVGFADMFLPSVIGSTIPSEMTRFIVATLSVTQLVYLSEAGAVILGSKIEISVLDLFLIYIERTLISLPIVVIAANIIF